MLQNVVSECVREFLASIGVVDPAVEAGLSKLDDLREVQTLRWRVIAHGNAHDVTGSAPYAAAVKALNALLQAKTPFSTAADPLFKLAVRRHAELKASAEAAVARWEWWTGSHYEPTPFHSERHRFTGGKKVKEPTSKKAKEGLHEYGLDASGIVRVERTYNEIGHYETFYVHAADRIEILHYSYYKSEPINAVLLLLVDGRPTERHMSAKHGKSIEHYHYDAERIVGIDDEHHGDNGFQSAQFELGYDAIGQLALIEQVYPSPLKRNQLWKRPDKGITLSTLLPLVREHFLHLLPAALRKLKLKEPAYALALTLDGEAYDHLLPPSLGIALASERDAFVAKHGAKAPDYLWSPPEWKMSDAPGLQLWDDRMKALVTPANQMLWEGDKYALATRLAHALAKELNGIELPIPKTDDFVVFACDITRGDGIEGVKKPRRRR